MSRRHEQFSATLRRSLSKVLATRLNDPRIAGLVTVTKLEVSPDFRHATVGVSVMPDRYERRTLHGLQHAARHIHALLYKEMYARQIPQLHFEIDASLKKQAEVLEAIRRATGSETYALPASDLESPDDEAPSDHDPQDDAPPASDAEASGGDADPESQPPRPASDSSPQAPEEPPS